MVGVGKSIPDYDNISNFTISTLPTPYMNPAIAIAKSPFKYVYTKKDGMEIPVLLTDLVTATESAYSAKSAHPFRRNGAPFRLKLSNAQLVN